MFPEQPLHRGQGDAVLARELEHWFALAESGNELFCNSRRHASPPVEVSPVDELTPRRHNLLAPTAAEMGVDTDRHGGITDCVQFIQDGEDPKVRKLSNQGHQFEVSTT